MGTRDQRLAALREIMKGNDFARVDISLNHAAIAANLPLKRRDTATIALVLGLTEAEVYNRGLHRSQVAA
jgi:hypothetical protein